MSYPGGTSPHLQLRRCEHKAQYTQPELIQWWWTLIGASKKTKLKVPCLAFILHNTPCEIVSTLPPVNLLSFLLSVELNYPHGKIHFSKNNPTALHHQWAGKWENFINATCCRWENWIPDWLMHRPRALWLAKGKEIKTKQNKATPSLPPKKTEAKNSPPTKTHSPVFFPLHHFQKRKYSTPLSPSFLLYFLLT